MEISLTYIGNKSSNASRKIEYNWNKKSSLNVHLNEAFNHDNNSQTR